MMTFRRASRTTLAAIALLGAEALAAPRAQVGSGQSFDGIWVIDISTSGFCPVRSKRLFAQVVRGSITKLLGLPRPTASGHVDGQGQVALAVRTLGYTARITGVMSGDVGEGAWSADSPICSGGDWRAHIAKRA